MTFIDTHCHLDFPPFIDDMTAVVKQAQQAGVSGLIIPAVSAERFELVCRLAEQYPPIFAAVGLHPIYTHQPQDLQQLSELLTRHFDKVIAIGEIGLDRFVAQPSIDEQQIYFSQQLVLAKTYALPVILHARRTHDLLYKALKQARLPRLGVLHGFSGSYEQAMQFVDLGYLIGIGGVITYQRANKTRQAVARLPLEALVLETDAPDMPLSGFQGQPNRPERIVQVFEALCQLRSESPDRIKNQIATNTRTLFKLSI
ncbi:TatD family hydrolase [Utexia brackfieldae]|uniref:TatD family hydrolase n=1 Tax=Utexia brackfieldae TaxID=3074108 RepID=UPI00370D3D5B